MPSTSKEYNKRLYVELPDGKGGTKPVPRDKVCFTMRETDNPDIVLTSDTAYRRMPDGSLRKIGKLEKKEEMVKLERRRQ
jgi:hypothetical protein